MDTHFNIVCLKWGDKYSAEYVNKLYNMVQRHTTIPHRFVCFTDDTVGIDDAIETKELLAPNMEGWWNKVSLFKETLHDLEGTIIFLDLDIIIVDNIDFLFTHKPEQPFLSLADFLFPEQSWNSSVFRLKIGTATAVWDKFINVEKRDDGKYYGFGRNFFGDQDYITYILAPFKAHLDFCYPAEKVVSYKRGVMNAGGPSPDTSIVVFHGNPNPHECAERWVKSNWQ